MHIARTFGRRSSPAMLGDVGDPNVDVSNGPGLVGYATGFAVGGLLGAIAGAPVGAIVGASVAAVRSTSIWDGVKWGAGLGALGAGLVGGTALVVNPKGLEQALSLAIRTVAS